jgi:hypothetical protein
MPKIRATIEFEAPHNVSKEEVMDFITSWLESGGGCRHPNDPLFDSLAEVKFVSYTRIREKFKP